MISDLETQGGAAIAAGRLAHSLTQKNYDVTRIVAIPDHDRPRLWRRHALRPTMPDFVDRQLSRLEQYGLPTKVRALRRYGNDKSALIGWLNKHRPDVVNLHNVHCAGWDAELIAQIAVRVPVVWTLHDMWSFTGRCAYSQDCTMYQNGCNAGCPTPREYPALPPSAIGPAWLAKQDLLRRYNQLIAVCPSAWLAQQARGSLWRGRNVKVIPNGVDLKCFRPGDRDAARSGLGLDPKSFIVLAYGDRASGGRKGERHVEWVIRQLGSTQEARRIHFLLIGDWPEKLIVEGARVSLVGHLEGTEPLRQVFDAADVLLFPSEADNLPNLVIEAAACGCPTIAFAVGGVPEIIVPNETGILVDSGDSDKLSKTIIDIFRGDTYALSREKCRKIAVDRYCASRQADLYTTVFDSLVARKQEFDLLWQ